MSRSISRRVRDLSTQFVRRLASETPREARAYAAACRPIEQLENRLLYAVQTATLITGGVPSQQIDGSVTVTLDPFGGFGTRYTASGAVFNPPGGDDSKESVNVSGLYFGPLNNFLSIDNQLTNNSPLSNQPGLANAGFIQQPSRQFAESVFDIPASATLDGNSYHIDLKQTLGDFDPTTNRTTLTQTYTITNTGTTTANNVVLDRYLLSSLNYQGSSFDSDHGGRSGDGRILFAFDTKGAGTAYVSIRNDDVEFNNSISPAYTIQTPTFSFNNGVFTQVNYNQILLQSNGRGIRDGTGNPPFNFNDIDTFPGDTDTPPDRLSNEGTNSGAPQNLVIQDRYNSLAPGGTIVYTTRTDFGATNDDFAGFLDPGVFTVSGVTVQEPVGDPARGATGIPATITINRGTGHLGAADIGIVSQDLDAHAYFPDGTPADYRPLGLIDPATGQPSSYAAVHFADGETQKTINITVLPDLTIEGQERIFVGMFRPSLIVDSTNFATDQDLGIQHVIGIQPLGTPVNINDPFPTFWDVGQRRQGDPNGPIEFTNIFIAPNDQPGTVGFSGGTVNGNNVTTTVSEGAGVLHVTVARLTPSDASAQVNFTYSFDAQSTAVAGQDYNFPAGFDPVTGIGNGRIDIGQLSTTIDIPIINDSTPESAETLIVDLNTAAPADLVTPNKFTATIIDDDQTGAFEFSAPSYAVTEGPNASVTVRVLRTTGTDAAATIPVNIAGVTAVAGVDYTDVSQVLAFAPGDAFKDLVIPILNDNTPEPTKTFTVTLGAPSSGSLGTPATATVTLTDDDVQGRVVVAAPAVTVREGVGAFARVQLTRTDPDNSVVTVSYATSDGSAQAGADYTAVSGTVVFGPGQSSAFVDIPILDDNLVEAAENFTLTLSNVTGLAQLGSPAAATITIADNDSAFSFAPASYSVGENAGVATLTISRAGDTTSPASVTFATVDGSAVAGTDYTATSGILSFAPGESSKTITVPIIDRPLDVNGDRSFGVVLSDPTGEGAQLGATTAATVAITDVDRLAPFVTDMQVMIPSSKGIERIVLSFSKPLDPASANSPSNYSIVSGDKKGRLSKFVRVSSVTYNPADNTVTIVPSPQLKSNAIYQLAVRSNNGLRDTTGHFLARDPLGTSSDFVARFGFGNKLTFRDPKGSTVNLKLSKKGSFVYTSGVHSSTEQTIALFNTVRGKSTLSGSVKAAVGKSEINLITGADGVNLKLDPRVFQVDQVVG